MAEKKYVLHVSVSPLMKLLNHKNIFSFSLSLIKVFVKLFFYVNKTM